MMSNILPTGGPLLRTARSASTMIILAIFGFASIISSAVVASHNAKFSTLFGEVHGRAVARNSGINAVAFTLGFFRKPIHLDLVANALGAGTAWDHAPSMRRVRQTLISSGLHVVLRRGTTFADISHELLKHPRKSLAVIRLKDDWNKDLFGHYLVFCNGGPIGLSVVDVGRYVGWESVAKIHDQLRADFNGHVLFVSPGGTPAAARVYTPESKRIILTVGEIATGPGMVQIPFLLKNTSREPIGIFIAKGTCYCFRGASIDETDHKIAPGQTAKISLDFKRESIGVGNIDREVLLKFTGNRKHWVTVFVRAHVTAKHPPIQLTWYPSQINFGVVRHHGRPGREAFTVLVPKRDSIGPPVASSESLSVIAVTNLGGASPHDAFGRIVHSYVIDLAKLPKGFIDDKITISTTDKSVPKIVIPITGQVEESGLQARKAAP